ncbi:MAG: glycosyltransferase [Candidatus Micrarchaeaceae archaeon]
MERLKIALIVDQPSWTGIGVYANELYKLIKDYGDIKLIYLGAHIDHVEYYEKLPNLKYTKNPYLIPKIVKYNYKVFNEEIRFKEYIKHYLGANYYSDLIKEKDIITIYDLLKDNYLRSIKQGFKQFAIAMLRNKNISDIKKIFEKRPSVIAISYETAKDIAKINKNVDVTVIHLWGNKSKFQFRDKVQSKKILGLDEKLNYILSVSGSGSNKRLDHIKAFANVLPENWKLIKIGASINSKKAINLANISNERYPLYFNASEAYLHLSDNEGFGWPLLEALFSKIPIIAKNTKINNEILHDYPLYLEEVNKDYLEKNINRILNLITVPHFNVDERDRLLKLYDENRAREAYLNFYNSISLNSN